MGWPPGLHYRYDRGAALRIQLRTHPPLLQYSDSVQEYTIATRVASYQPTICDGHTHYQTLKQYSISTGTVQYRTQYNRVIQGTVNSDIIQTLVMRRYIQTLVVMS